jgi:hypothetical protein
MVVSRADASVGRRAALGLLGLVLTCGSLVGCQSNPEPPPIEAASSSPSPSPSPTEAPPTLPAEANGTSEAAAKAFVRHYINVLNYAGPAGDADAVRDLSDESCAACSAIADFIQEVEEDGGAIEGDGWRVQGLRVVSATRAETVVDVETLVAEQRVRTSRDAKERTFTGGNRLKTFWLAFDGSTWTVTRLDQPQ